MPPSSLHRPLFHAPKRRRRADGAKHRARARTPREPADAGEAPLVDLHVFLYSGVVRDLDPDFFGSNSGDSDAACQMTVEPADSSLDVKEVRLSDILLNSNEPDFKMFFEFGSVWKSNLRRVRPESPRRPPCHRRDACSMAWRCRSSALDGARAAAPLTVEG